MRFHGNEAVAGLIFIRVYVYKNILNVLFIYIYSVK